MSTEGLILAAFALAIGLGWVLLPLLSKSRVVNAAEQKQRDQLLALYEQVMTNIRDLDEDHSTGKIQAEAYQVEREQWVERGVHILETLDQSPAASKSEIKTRKPATEAPTQTTDALDDAIEAAVAKLREAQANT